MNKKGHEASFTSRRAGFAHIEIIFVILLVAVFGVVFWVSRNSGLPMVSQSAPISEELIDETEDLTDETVFENTEDWAIYANQELEFRIRYPSELMDYKAFDGAVVFWFTGSQFNEQFAPLQFLGRGNEDTAPIDALIAETPSNASTGEKNIADFKNILLNNAKGIMVTRQYPGNMPRREDYASDETGYNIYVTGSSGKKPVIRILGTKNGIDNFETLEKIIKTFEFVD